jgi:hypothetical protein
LVGSAPITKIAQQLSSGITVHQDFKDSVRFVMFQTGVEGWEYATHGGTAFIVSFRGKPFGLTCRHVFKDFHWDHLAITGSKFGKKGEQFAKVKSLVYPSDPRGEAVDTDILDIAVIEFANDVGADFFTDAPYILDTKTYGTSSEGDAVLVNGALKEKSDLSEQPVISPTFCLLEFHDRGATSTDPLLREAFVQIHEPKFSSVTGISGSPVYNLTAKKLCGMVVRGTLTGRECRIWYIDIFDIMQILIAMIENRSTTDYTKHVLRWVPVAVPQS